MTLPDPPESIQTKNGLTAVHVLPWMQYIKRRIKQNGIKYLFEKTSAGYPRIFSLGYYRNRGIVGEIVVAKVGNWQLRYLHELGHANCLDHVFILGDVMNPYSINRGEYQHICTYIAANAGACRYDNIVSMNCYCNGMFDSCSYLDVVKA